VRHGVAHERLHEAAVAQDGDAIAQAEHVGQPVRHVDDRHAGARQVAEDVEQMVSFRRRQRRRRLVEREQAAVERERAGDLEQLAMRDRQRLHRRVRRDRQLETREQIAGARAHVGLAKPAEAAGDLPPREDVRGGRQVGEGEHLLVHESDAARQRIARARERDRRAAERDLAAVGAQAAREDVEQRRFPGAVLADDSV
jgi:hypothetical protein